MSSTEEYQQKQFYLPDKKVVTTKSAKRRLDLINANFGFIPFCTTIKELEKQEFSTNFKRNNK